MLQILQFPCLQERNDRNMLDCISGHFSLINEWGDSALVNAGMESSMLEGCKTAQERWGGVHDLIDRWLLLRRQLIEVGIALRARQEYTPTDTAHIQAFCRQLIDYVSIGHFTVYEQLALEAKEFQDGSALKLLTLLLPEIDSTTQLVSEFYDRFDTQEHNLSQLEALPFSLQALSAIMAERFTLEDRLIKELHDVHREKNA